MGNSKSSQIENRECTVVTGNKREGINWSNTWRTTKEEADLMDGKYSKSVYPSQDQYYDCDAIGKSKKRTDWKR